MTHYNFELDQGYFVSLKVLTQHLTDMSHDIHKWGVIAVPGSLPSALGASFQSLRLMTHRNCISTK